MNIVYLFTFAILFVSCADDPYGDRSQVIPYDPATAGLCTDYIDPLAQTCSTECDLTENHEADRDERLKLEEELEESLANATPEEKEFRMNNFRAAKAICVPGVLTARPDGAVFINSDFCSCLNGVTEIINLGCQQKCSGTSEGPTLFASVSVDQRVSENPEMKNLQGWCNNELTNDPAAGVSPSCVFEVTDGVTTQDLNLATLSGNNFTVNLNSLSKYKTYTGKIVEKGTNTTNPSSSSIQIYRRNPPPSSVPFPGVLRVTPISQYTCITRVGASDTQSRVNYYDNSARLHFYYNDREKPPIRPPNPNLFCHDIENLGPVDRATFPRLELISQAFSLWDTTDIRFSDVNGDGKMDINELIEEQIIRQFGITPPTIDYFVAFQWPNAPQPAEGAGTIPTLGYMMRVFVNPTTGRGTCPTQEDYQGADPSFIVLGQYAGVDTEALYIAFRQEINLTEEDGTVTAAPDDVLLIRQSLLEQIWWFQDGNLQVEPDETTAGQRTIHFYYPPDPVHPYIQKSYQELYTIKDRAALSAGSEDDTTGGLPSYDKRFGCVPAAISPSYD